MFVRVKEPASPLTRLWSKLASGCFTFMIIFVSFKSFDFIIDYFEITGYLLTDWLELMLSFFLPIDFSLSFLTELTFWDFWSISILYSKILLIFFLSSLLSKADSISFFLSSLPPNWLFYFTKLNLGALNTIVFGYWFLFKDWFSESYELLLFWLNCFYFKSWLLLLKIFFCF
jgi:hypothetical protein